MTQRYRVIGPYTDWLPWPYRLVTDTATGHDLPHRYRFFNPKRRAVDRAAQLNGSNERVS